MSNVAKQKSDLSRAFSEDGANKTHVGGQALIEGVMMRGKYNWAVGVREPDGSIYEEQHDLSSGQAKNGWMYWPLVRGCRAMVESLVLGYKALEIAALHAFNEDDDGAEGEGARAKAGEAVAQAPATSGMAGCESAASKDDSGVDVLVGEGSERAQDAAVAGEAGSASDAESFSWKDDFGRPDTMIDALGAQRSLEVVQEPAPDASKPQAAAASEPAGEAADDDDAVFGKKEMAVSMVLGLVMGVVLFIVSASLVGLVRLLSKMRKG